MVVFGLPLLSLGGYIGLPFIMDNASKQYGITWTVDRVGIPKIGEYIYIAPYDRIVRVMEKSLQCSVVVILGEGQK